MSGFPHFIEELLLSRVRRLLGSHEKGRLTGSELKRLSVKVLELSDYFTKREYDRPDNYLSSRELMAAYMAYFLPSNILKTQKPLKELMLHRTVREGLAGDMAVLDLGCGPGTASLGLLNFLSQGNIRPGTVSGIEITLADSVSENLEEAEFLARGYRMRNAARFAEIGLAGLELKRVHIDMGRISAGSLEEKRYDLVVLSNSIGELGSGDGRIQERIKLIETLSRRNLKESGSIIIIEPALRGSSRDLLRVREELVSRNVLKVYSPCIAAGRCGALDDKRDWCHEGQEWEPPPVVRELDRLTGFEKSRLKYSYLALRKDGLSLRDAIGKRDGEMFRVVSDLLVRKGEKRLWLCGGRGRVQAGRLDRDRSQSNCLLDEIKRGDVVEIGGLEEKGELFRIGRGSSVRIEAGG